LPLEVDVDVFASLLRRENDVVEGADVGVGHRTILERDTRRAPSKSARRCVSVPAGRTDNRPAIHRWVNAASMHRKPRRGDRKSDISVVPMGLLTSGPDAYPAMNCWAIFDASLRGA
jgi:hypothetical protein